MNLRARVGVGCPRVVELPATRPEPGDCGGANPKCVFSGHHFASSLRSRLRFSSRNVFFGGGGKLALLSPDVQRL